MIAPDRVSAKVSPATRAIIAVDYAGQPCDYDALSKIADRNKLVLIADAYHSLGAAYRQILSLPMFPAMTDEDVDIVISAVREAVS